MVRNRRSLRLLADVLALLTVLTLQPSIRAYAVEEQTAGSDTPADSVPVTEGADDSAENENITLELALLTLDPDSLTLDYSQSLALAAMTNAAKDAVTWSSSDENVVAVSVNADGRVTVTGTGVGAAVITCAVGEQVRTFNVTVNPPDTLQITNVDYPSTLNLSNRGWELGNGTVISPDDLKTLTSSLKRVSGELVEEPYTWVFDGGMKRCEVKDINDNVPFSQISEGGGYIWTLEVMDVRGRSVSVELPIQVVTDGDTVVSNSPGKYAPVITLPNSLKTAHAIGLQAGETKQLGIAPLPDGVASGLIWVSYDPTVATVSSDGMVTGVGAGSTTIVCRAMDNSAFSAGCTVNVRAGTADAGDVPVEGQNFIPGTGTMTNWPMRGPLSVISGEDGIAVLDWQANPALDWNAADTTPIKYSLLRGKEITVSLYVRSDDANMIDNTLRENGGGLLVDVNIGTETESRKRWVFLSQISYPKLSKQWQRVSETFTLTDDVFAGIVDADYILSDDSCITLTITNRSIYRMQIKQLKVEIGSSPTDWTPAPEDAS